MKPLAPECVGAMEPTCNAGLASERKNAPRPVAGARFERHFAEASQSHWR